MDSTIANLARLAQRPGVRATLVLSRQTGDIVQSSGLDREDDTIDGEPITASTDSDESNTRRSKLPSLTQAARLIHEYVKSSAAMAKQFNGTIDDQVKLLRLRTNNLELVIVPDAHFIAVVIHDTPSA